VNNSRADYTIVIPFFKGDETIYSLVERIRERGEWPVIIVNDSGVLNKVLAGVSSAFNKVQIINLWHNHGQHYATFQGLKAALGKHVITMDEDLQHSSDDIAAFIAHHELSQTDIVYARRKSGRLNKFIQRALIFLFFPGGPETTSSFRLLDEKLVKSIVSMKPKFYQLEGLIMARTPSYSYVDVGLQASQRQSVGSGYTVISKFRLISDLISFYSPRPWIGLNVLTLVASVVLLVILEWPISLFPIPSLMISLLVVYSYIFALVRSKAEK
jgi:glycosyltransferase involved in cell wall biosynthesis